MRRAAFIVLLFFIVPAIQGCAATGDVVHSRDRGTSIVYPVTEEQAWDIAQTVFRWVGAETIEQHRDKDYILATRGRHGFSYDAVGCAWVAPVDGEDTMVTVVTQHERSVNIATHFTRTTFLLRFAQAVDIIKAGKPLPQAAPAE